MKILNVVGARPNFVKMAPLLRAFREKLPEVEALLVHTGQHYDRELSRQFFDDLSIPKPDVHLDIPIARPAEQIATILTAFDAVLDRQSPDAVLVVGDVNSTLACALAAAHRGIPLLHVEAGLRSGDRTMPEEVNRTVTDALSELLFCSEPSGVRHLSREGIASEKVFLVGNVMVDSLLQQLPRADSSDVLERLDVEPERYALLTLHRPSNVDRREALVGILDALSILQQDLPVVFPAHPRARRGLETAGLEGRLRQLPNLRLSPPLGHLDFVRLLRDARVVLTDSGGVQEETTVVRVPCLTLRDTTERPATVEAGTNQVVGNDSESILEGYRRALRFDRDRVSVPEMWDGRAAERIVDVIARELVGRR